MRLALPTGWLPELSARAARLRPRERLLLFVAALALGLLFWDSAILGWFVRREQAANGELSGLVGMVEGEAPVDPEIAALAELGTRAETLRVQVDAARAELRRQSAGFVEPQRMVALVRDLLAARAGLQLQRLANLPPEELRSTAVSDALVDTDAPAGDGEAARPAAVAYVHGLEIVVEGSYQDIYDSLRALEAQSWHVLWRSVEIEVVDYPRARARIVVATLGVDRDWIGG